MPQIIPIRDLKNTNTISQLCHESKEPIFVTKNGYGDMVLMSMETYEGLGLAHETYCLLKEAEFEAQKTTRRFTHDEVFASLRENITNATETESV